MFIRSFKFQIEKEKTKKICSIISFVILLEFHGYRLIAERQGVFMFAVIAYFCTFTSLPVICKWKLKACGFKFTKELKDEKYVVGFLKMRKHIFSQYLKWTFHWKKEEKKRKRSPFFFWQMGLLFFCFYLSYLLVIAIVVHSTYSYKIQSWVCFVFGFYYLVYK